MKTTTQFIAAALVSAALATPALADNPYVALDLGQAKAQDACSASNLPPGSSITGCKDSAAALRIALGSQFAPQFAGEVSYGTYGSAAQGTGTVPGRGAIAGGNRKINGFQLAGIGLLPVSDVVSISGKVGIAYLNYDAYAMSTTNTNLLFGIGVQFKVNSDVAVRAQYENMGTVGDASTTGTAKVSLISAGVVYKF